MGERYDERSEDLKWPSSKKKIWTIGCPLYERIVIKAKATDERGERPDRVTSFRLKTYAPPVPGVL